VPDPPAATPVPEQEQVITTRVYRAYPNPAQSLTRVPVLLARSAGGGNRRYHVKVDVFDVAGRRVRSVFNGRLTSGRHFFDWDGRTGTGNVAGAGIYFMRVMVDGRGVGTVKITRIP
jgi:hypothetical protein